MSIQPVKVPRDRYLDPHRREQILTATIVCLAEQGVAHTTHRAIAARAGVPLATLTYHFATLGDLCREAFALYTSVQTTLLVELTTAAGDVDELVEVLVSLVHRGEGEAGARHAVVGFELYLAALRDPGLRALTRAWTAASRRAYMRFVDADTADDLDALLEGLILHTLLDAEGSDPARTRAALRRVLPNPHLNRAHIRSDASKQTSRAPRQ